jgi:hypothetical protein
MPLDALFITCFFLNPAASAWNCGLWEYESDAGHKNALLTADYFNVRKFLPLRSAQFAQADANAQKTLE